MAKISYFYKGNYYDVLPNVSNSDIYLTIIHYEPDENNVLTELNSIPNLNQLIENTKNKKTIFVIYAGDEGYYLETCKRQKIKDTIVETLNKWSIKNSFDKNYFHFICHNLLTKEIIKTKNYNMIGWGGVYESENYLFLDDLTEEMIDYRPHGIEKLFLTYNRSFRIHRFYLIFKLIESGLIDNSIYSYHRPAVYDEHIKHIHSLIIEHGLSKTILNKVLHLDKNIISQEVVAEEGHWGQKVIYSNYLKTFLSLVTETQVGQDTVYLSEKTFKPIVSLHPFISVSSPYTLKKIKELGYKTFDTWWDESYDECDNYVDRINKIMIILTDLSKKSQNELNSIKLQMYDVLKHNRDTYYKRIEIDFLKKTLISIENNLEIS